MKALKYFKTRFTCGSMFPIWSLIAYGGRPVLLDLVQKLNLTLERKNIRLHSQAAWINDWNIYFQASVFCYLFLNWRPIWVSRGMWCGANILYPYHGWPDMLVWLTCLAQWKEKHIVYQAWCKAIQSTNLDCGFSITCFIFLARHFLSISWLVKDI